GAANLTAVDDAQILTLTGLVSGDSYTLSLGSQTTGPIAYDASAADVQTALAALPNIGNDNIKVAGSYDSNSGSASYTITYEEGLFTEGADSLVVTPSLAGGTAAIAAATPTGHVLDATNFAGAGGVILVGGSGADTLTGSGQDDTLTGGAGLDH